MRPRRPRPEATARDAALRLLKRREHSRRELGEKLAARGFPADEVAAALDDLEGRRLLSDARFAECFVRHRVGQGYGPLRIRLELERQGIKADEYLTAHADEWLETTRRAYRKRFGETAPADIKERAKRIRWLEGRGFPHDAIRAAIDGTGEG